MRIEENNLGCILLFLDDGTEIIFSKEATKRIKTDKEQRAKRELELMLKRELELMLKSNIFIQRD